MKGFIIDLLKDWGALVLGIILILLRDLGKELFAKFKKSRKLKKFELSPQIDKQINDILIELRIKFHASGCHILSFSNGTESFSGISYNFTSMIHESVSNGVPSQINNFQQIPSSQYADLLNKIKNENSIYVPSDENSFISNLHLSYGVKSAHKFLIGNLISDGILSIYWVKEKQLTTNQLNEVKDSIKQLHRLLKLKVK